MTDFAPEPPVRYPSPSEVRETCLFHKSVHTLGTVCPGCETDFIEGYAHHRGEL